VCKISELSDALESVAPRVAPVWMNPASVDQRKVLEQRLDTLKVQAAVDNEEDPEATEEALRKMGTLVQQISKLSKGVDEPHTLEQQAEGMKCLNTKFDLIHMSLMNITTPYPSSLIDMEVDEEEPLDDQPDTVQEVIPPLPLPPRERITFIKVPFICIFLKI